MVEISVNSYKFLMGEVDQIHALCDRAQVPRVIDGEMLSMSQRVAVLEGVQRGLVTRLGMTHPVNLH